MKSRRKNLVLVVTLIILGLLCLRECSESSKWRKYDPTELRGLSQVQVEQRLGKPTSRLEDDGVWIYQYGMDPEVFVEFDGEGRVTKVWSAVRDGSKE